ncbi:carboxylesterase 2 [Methyloglobulus morosus KoM1]|uniref:Carboxylesterase 2 n=1 Tax=Methyloglobulus morosus KoM1 TaxID=1116472 RepID=V5BHS5_9GAMM|nr:carboxylesterase 2 [Methyloglobulus morosus]ESS72860.1 carboxylesterase 2 [Methyloglobulus morosus KoM1]
MHPELSTINITPTSTHKYSVIWLHGLGADGHDFESIVPSLQLKAEANIHFVFPNAPIQPVTINNHMKMRAWFDILAMSLEKHTVDIPGIYQSADLVQKLIQKELDKGITAENIMLAGFSQGGAIALHVGLRYPQKLAGILALSTYLPTIDQLRSEGSVAGKTTPIFMAHGILDGVIAIEAGKLTFDNLTSLGYCIEWHDYLMEHSVCAEEILHMSAFMNLIFI